MKYINVTYHPYCLFFVFFFFVTNISTAQDSRIIDQVVAVVGDKIILQSDIEKQYLSYIEQKTTIAKGQLTCRILEEMLLQKMLVAQAQVDSISVTEAQINLQLDQRMSYFIEHIGSKEKLEEYFGKTIFDIKEDFRETIAEQLLMQRMQSEITKNVKVTPAEVRKYFHSLPEDSLPLIEGQIELNHIVIYPPAGEDAIFETKEKLLELRKRIIEGEKFSTLARLYSEDPSSAMKGGEIGFMSRAELTPQYADAAFKLREGGVSGIVETEFGYHIIQLIEKKENKVNTRHILLRPKFSGESIRMAMQKLDSIAQLIKNNSMTFEEAAERFSQDDDTRKNGGLMINYQRGNSRFTPDELHPFDFYALKTLSLGQISEAYESRDKTGKTVYKILKLKTQTQPHRANLTDDYSEIKEMAERDKQNEVMEEWVQEKIKTTYIYIHPSYANCNFLFSGWLKK
mgnify:CR=1 FL=1